MPLFSVPHLRLSGLSAAVPKNVVDNLDYPWPTAKDGELFVKTTGIARRRLAPPGMTAADLCEAAARQLLADLKWNPDEIGVLLLVTQTPDYRIPATSTILQHKLGLNTRCMALDVNLGCSGYVYGLSILGGLLRLVGAKKGLLLVGDVSSKVVSQADKSVAPLFADAATATALEIDDKAPHPFTFNLRNDGAGFDAIIIPDGGMRSPASPESFVQSEIEPGITRSRNDMILDGMGIFNFSLREVAPNVNELLEHLSAAPADYDFAVFHQANKLMNESVRKKLKLTPEQVPYSLDEFGNTSSATVPLTMVVRLAEALRSRPLRLLLSGFGVGLSWGCVDLTTNGVAVSDLVEI